MKTARIQISSNKALEIEQCKAGGAFLAFEYNLFGIKNVETQLITPNQSAQIIVGLLKTMTRDQLIKEGAGITEALKQVVGGVEV